MFDSFLKAFLNSIYVALLSVLLFIFNDLFCYFIVPLFYHTCFNWFKWAFLCHHLASFLKLAHLAAYFGQIFIFISFYLTLYMALPCSKSVYTHILRCDLCFFYVSLLTLNDSMSYYCFSHYFNDISMVTVF